MRNLSILLTLWLSLACLAAANASQTPAQAIKVAHVKMVQAYLAKDATVFFADTTDDYTHVSQQGQVFSRKSATAELSQGFQRMKDVTYEHVVLDVKVESPTRAIARVRSHLVATTPRAN